MADAHGSFLDETCGRNGCIGIIERMDDDGGCSCHINPPCSYCVDATFICPVCDWNEVDEPDFETVEAAAERIENAWSPSRIVQLADLDNSEVNWISKSHTNSSMIKEGVYPEGMTSGQVEQQVRGTFGGRFAAFDNGKFKYIAYTD
jgi:hypothetical protein